MEEKGIKELGEFLNAVMKLGMLCYGNFKDGISADDFMVIFMQMMNDPDFKHAIVGIDEIPGEIKNLSFQEGVEMLGLMLSSFNKMKAA